MVWEPAALRAARQSLPRGSSPERQAHPEWVKARALVGIGEALCVIADDLNRISHHLDGDGVVEEVHAEAASA
jgi:hypothetical protein